MLPKLISRRLFSYGGSIGTGRGLYLGGIAHFRERTLARRGKRRASCILEGYEIDGDFRFFLKHHVLTTLIELFHEVGVAITRTFKFRPCE